MLHSAALAARLADVRERIARIATRAARDPSHITLVAVSKTVDADCIRVAADAGQIDFGENKVQEALDKMDRLSDLPIRWHLIGHVQSNKAKKAGARFDVIHSVDGQEIGQRLDAAAAGAARELKVLLQVDLAGEPTKHGAREEELAAILDAARGWQAARPVGLMLIPPAADDPEMARPYFRALRLVRQHLLEGGIPSSMLDELSMGMSHDFEVAIQEGATMVRVGTAIFGERPVSPPRTVR